MLRRRMRIWTERAILLAASLAAVSAIPSGALADDCMCLIIGAPQTPASQASEGSEALSRPVDEIASLPGAILPAAILSNDPLTLTFVATVPGDLAHRSTESEQILWCEGGDDPRCSPASGHSTSDFFSTLPLLAPRSLGTHPPRVTTVQFAFDPGHGLEGHHRSLERPPRG